MATPATIKTTSLKNYILTVLAFLFLSYSTYFLFDFATVRKLGQEDGIFEYLTALAFLVASFLFLRTYFSSNNVFFLLLGLLMFFGFGEEISWGQRIFGYATPEGLSKVNVQHEFTLHNIDLFNPNNFDGTQKTGLAKMFTANFVYKVFCFSFGILLPLAFMYIRPVRLLIDKIRLPVPPLQIGLLFLVNVLLFKTLNFVFYEKAMQEDYMEIRECNSAIIFLALCIYFFRKYRASETAQPLNAY